MIHPSEVWVKYFSSQPRVILDGLAAAGWINKSGNKYFTVLLDSSIYSTGCAWHDLDVELPLYGFKKFAFKGEVAQEPILFFSRELEIKYDIQGVKSIKITDFPPMSNVNNNDLGTYFNNGKLHKSKKDRERKLKEKKAK